MTLHFHCPKPRYSVLILLIFVSLSLSATVFGKRKASGSHGKSARNGNGRHQSARAGRAGHRSGKLSARDSRRGRKASRMSARDVRRERALTAREQASSLKALERRLHRPLTKRERTAELRRIGSSHRRAIEEARRRAEAARQAAIARQRAIDQAMRSEVQTFIAKDDSAGRSRSSSRCYQRARQPCRYSGRDGSTYRENIFGCQPGVGLASWLQTCSTIKLNRFAGLSEKVIPPVDVVNL